MRPEHRNHVWSYDFVQARTHEGRKFRTLNVVDEFTRECLAIRADRKLKAIDVIDVLSDLFILRGVPAHMRFGQWSGVHREERANLDYRRRREDRLHRSGLALGKRLRRELQRKAT